MSIPTQRTQSLANAPVDSRAGDRTTSITRTGGTSHAERVFRVQHAFTQLGGEVQGLADLARASGVDDSAVYRILRSGVTCGAFSQVGRGRYRLGPSAARIGTQALMNSIDPTSDEELRECLDRVHQDTDGGLAFLFGLNHFGRAQRQFIEMSVGNSDLSELGANVRDVLTVNRSLRVGAAGRSILAHLPEQAQRRVIAEPVPRGAGPGVYRDRDKLVASLAEIRLKGYALGFQECVRGWNSFAAPVFGVGGVLGAVVVLKPAHEVSVPREECVAAVRVAAAELGVLDGGSGTERVPEYVAARGA
ncbi:IclR family transcriptional regulator C-terminal domain-containing protein [Streptomyces lavendulae]|uniref:IclR family transcriptional regulator domain-containing protein n=1 Tax=Streptomyces TaxID=1883 RepID=UPI0024738ADE|nr:IclR family transcriptional regulator C-terminal domain-containing protein [Streptomyces sp. SPB4]MDH6538110.1 DNA-binding IclR family transcriptional regulator [Streptomyces sp. SPB4]